MKHRREQFDHVVRGEVIAAFFPELIARALDRGAPKHARLVMRHPLRDESCDESRKRVTRASRREARVAPFHLRRRSGFGDDDIRRGFEEERAVDACRDLRELFSREAHALEFPRCGVTIARRCASAFSVSRWSADASATTVHGADSRSPMMPATAASLRLSPGPITATSIVARNSTMRLRSASEITSTFGPPNVCTCTLNIEAFVTSS